VKTLEATTRRDSVVEDSHAVNDQLNDRFQ
jgi:hypothetical protein